MRRTGPRLLDEGRRGLDRLVPTARPVELGRTRALEPAEAEGVAEAPCRTPALVEVTVASLEIASERVRGAQGAQAADALGRADRAGELDALVEVGETGGEAREAPFASLGVGGHLLRALPTRNSTMRPNQALELTATRRTITF